MGLSKRRDRNGNSGSYRRILKASFQINIHLGFRFSSLRSKS
jgi:hypothetical protein